MAENKVKRGFFLYFLIFVLILVAAFMVCVVIMIFNPGKTLLGFQYFKNDKEILLKTTDASKTDLNIVAKEYKSIIVETDIANISIEKNTYDQNGVYLINKTRGFIKTDKVKDMSYEVVITGENELKISVSAGLGFLNFSDNISVVFNFCNDYDISNFSKTPLKFTTGSGSISIDNILPTKEKPQSETRTIENLSLDLSTQSGKITFGSRASNYYKELNLKTDSGTIDLTSMVNPDNNTTQKDALQELIETKKASKTNVWADDEDQKKQDLKVLEDLESEVNNIWNGLVVVNGSTDEIKAKLGNINDNLKTIEICNENVIANVLKDVSSNLATKTNSANIEIVSGRLKLHNSNSPLNITCLTGYLDIGQSSNLSIKTKSAIINLSTAIGNVDFVNSSEIIESAKVNIHKAYGIVNMPSGKDSDIDIDEAYNEVYIKTESGEIKVGSNNKPLSDVVNLETKSGNITGYFANDKDIFIKSETGRINATFKGQITGEKNITNKSGQVNVNFDSGEICFNFKSADLDKEFDLSKVSFDILNGRKLEETPYVIDGADKAHINITTNGKVVLDIND